MKCFIGIDLGSTTTKAVVMDDTQAIIIKTANFHGSSPSKLDC